MCSWFKLTLPPLQLCQHYSSSRGFAETASMQTCPQREGKNTSTYVSGKQTAASSNSTTGTGVRFCLPPTPTLPTLLFWTSKHWNSYKEDPTRRSGEEIV